MLSKDENPDVRDAVAWNKNSPTEVLVTLSQDKDSSVRKTVAMNKNTPTDILVMLSKDEYPSVCTAANKALKERRMKSQQKQER